MENEAELYHAAATVSTLLLKLGEVTRKFQSSTSTKEEEEKAKAAASSEDGPLFWHITFEQLIASLLTDNLLVQYFDTRYDINNILNEYKSQHA